MSKAKIGAGIRPSFSRINDKPSHTRPSPAAKGITHRVERGDSFASIGQEHYGAALPKQSPERLGAAVQIVLERIGRLKLDQPLADRVGDTLHLSPADEFVATFHNLDRAGMLPDARAGDRSAQLKANARAITTFEPGHEPSLEMSPPSLQQVREVAARGHAASRPVDPPLAPLPQPDLPRPDLVAPGSRENLPTPALTAVPRPITDRHFVALCARHHVPKEALRQVADFCAQNHIPLHDLEPVLATGGYRGAEGGEALTMAAVALDAIENQRLDPDNRDDFQTVFMHDLEHGAVHFQRAETKADKKLIGDSYALYDWQRNTVILPSKGINIGSLWTRACLLHEARHAIQDSLHDRASRIASEQEAHEVAAQYVLRSTGVIRPADGGVVLDVKRAQALLAGHIPQLDVPITLASPDWFAVNHVLQRVVDESRSDDAPEQVSIEPPEYNTDALLTSFDPKESFATCYLRSFEDSFTGIQIRDELGSDKAVLAWLQTPRQKDGL